MGSFTDPAKVGVACLLVGAVLWFVSQYYYVSPSPPSGFLLTQEKLKENIAKSSETLVNALVSHRGFHYANDDMKRPLENTVAAYERAWAANVIYAECDVMSTKDGEIVLSHDNNLKRLALHPDAATKPISSLDYGKDILYMPLKDGSKVPKLVDVLQRAQRISSKARLVVEIKDAKVETAKKVATIVASELGTSVGLVMSFHLNAIAEYAKSNPRKRKVPSMLLCVRKNSGDGSFVFDVKNLSVVEEVIKVNQLDGVYVEYDPSFLTDARFAQFCKRYKVGVWGLTKDSASLANDLIARGVELVNSDFSDDFFHT